MKKVQLISLQTTISILYVIVSLIIGTYVVKFKKILTRFRTLFSGRLPIQAPCPGFGDQHHKTPKKQNKEIQNYNTHF